MLRLLLDEHISPEVAKGVRRRNRALVIHTMVQWEGGRLSWKGRFRLLVGSSEAILDPGYL